MKRKRDDNHTHRYSKKIKITNVKEYNEPIFVIDKGLDWETELDEYNNFTKKQGRTPNVLYIVRFDNLVIPIKTKSNVSKEASTIKIGFSNDFFRRLKELKSKFDDSLSVLALFPIDDIDNERKIHRVLRDVCWELSWDFNEYNTKETYGYDIYSTSGPVLFNVLVKRYFYILKAVKLNGITSNSFDIEKFKKDHKKLCNELKYPCTLFNKVYKKYQKNLL